MKHLWGIKHDYYCEESNYSGLENTHHEYKTFNDFLEEFGDSDLDMNLVFRWDWIIENKSDDEYYRDGELYIFMVAQRNGYKFSAQVSVCRKDEQSVIDFLTPRLEHLMKLWEPLKSTP